MCHRSFLYLRQEKETQGLFPLCVSVQQTVAQQKQYQLLEQFSPKHSGYKTYNTGL